MPLKIVYLNIISIAFIIKTTVFSGNRFKYVMLLKLTLLNRTCHTHWVPLAESPRGESGEATATAANLDGEGT